MISFALLTEKFIALPLGITLKKQFVTKREYVHDILQQHPARHNPRSKHSGCEEAMYSD